MREILFRGKRIDHDEWVEGAFLNDRDGDFYICPAVSDISYGDGGNRQRIRCWYKVDPSTVGQYTGLKDKNGKRIWEGDIVRYTFDSPDDPTATANGLKVRTGRIFWSDWSSSFAVIGGINGSASLNNVEVIGNIHDNPELLEDNRS